MGTDPAKRKLAAILATDVVGSSRLMGADEEGTVSRLQSLLLDVIGPEAAKHQGRIFNTSGDGALIEFPSVVEAARAAMAMQQSIKRMNDRSSAADPMEMRVGIHLGDVIADENGDVWGEGVNIAARLESLSEPGGICISEDAYRQVRGRLSAGYIDLGGQSLKNIEEPVRVYAIAGFGSAIARRGQPGHPPSLPDKPSIAVLPFQTLGAAEDQQYFADAITEDIITALSRWRWFFVIARNSSFVYKNRAVDVRRVGRELGVRYVLEGSVQRFKGRARITTQLIDAASAAHIWADVFDSALRDIFALRDEVTEKVVTAFEPAMLSNEAVRTARRPIRDLSAFDCFQRGMWHLNRVSYEGYVEAVALFREAVARDPDLPQGHIGLARILYGAAVYGWSAAPRKDLEESERAARRAISLDRRDALAHHALSGASLYLGRHQEAVTEAEETILLNPNLATGHYRLGQVLIYAGRAAEAIEPIERSIRHSPLDPQLDLMSTTLALAHYHVGNYAEALGIAKRVEKFATLGLAAAIVAAALGRLGRVEEAAKPLAAFVNAFKEEVVQRGRLLTPYAGAADRADFLAGLQMAGWDGKI